jgi:3-oxoacyl-[acyl-carrier-protein] synthase III
MFINYIGYATPPTSVSNDEVLRDGGSNWTNEKVADKLGIESRFVADKMSLTKMVVAAAEDLFDKNPQDKNKIDGLIVCTQSPDCLIPTTACVVQNELGLKKELAAFDINLGCSGYVYALAIAKGLIQSGTASCILVLTGDRYTAHLEPTDVSNRLIFGDGATATIVGSVAEGLKLELMNFTLGTDGQGAPHLQSGLGGMNSDKSFLKMNGTEVFNFTMREVPRLVMANLDKNRVNFDDVGGFIFHQANHFMLESLRKKLKIPEEKWLTYYKNFGNTVSSTIPLVLGYAMTNRKQNQGEYVQLVGFGVGYSWGAVTLKTN